MSITLDGTNGITTPDVNDITVGRGAGDVATNIAVGTSALDANTTGAFNVAIGTDALGANTTASANTAVGYQALYSNTTGVNITSVGYQAGYSNQTGTESVHVGYGAAYSTTSSFNTFVGPYAGYWVTTGAKNTILGRFDGNQSGLDIRTANNYIVLSDGDGNPRQIIDSSGNLLVGTTATSAPPVGGFCLVTFLDGANKSSSIDIGHQSGVSSGFGYARFYYGGAQIGHISQNGTTAVTYNTTSDYRLKENVVPMTGALAKVAALKPVTYTWKAAPDEIGEGFIAHELAEVCPLAVTGEKDAVNEDGSIKPQGIDTSFLVATLTAAIQELKAEFDAYKASHP